MEPKLEEARKDSPQSLQERHDCRFFQTSPTWERTHFCHFEASGWWAFAQHPYETDTGTKEIE